MILAAALGLLAFTGVYWNHFDNGFHFDDMHTIVKNAAISDLSNLPRIFADATTTSSLPLNQAYRPMVTALNTIDYALGDGVKSTRWYHIHIYAEFVLLLILLWAVGSTVVQRLSSIDGRWVMLLATGLFAFHATVPETINYIISRSDEHSTLQVLLVFACHLWLPGRWRLLALLPLALGILTKPTAVMAAPLLVLYEWLLAMGTAHAVVSAKGKKIIAAQRPSLFNRLVGVVRATWPHLVLAIGMFLFSRSMFAPTWNPSDLKMADYLPSQPYVVFLYVRFFFFPIGISADTDLDPATATQGAHMAIGIGVILAMLWLAVVCMRRPDTRPVAYGILWFFIALAPSSSFIALAELMNHHRTFFPYIGLVWAVCWGGWLVARHLASERGMAWAPHVMIGIGLLAIACNAFGSYQRNEVWHNSLSLWKDVTEKSPRNGRGMMNYAVGLMNASRYEEAYTYLDRATRSNYSRHPYLYVNLAIASEMIAMKKGDEKLLAKVEDYYRTSISMGPNYPDCYYFYAKWLYAKGRVPEAQYNNRMALQLSPVHALALDLMKKVDATADLSLQQAENKVASEPSVDNLIGLSLQQYLAGRFEDCIATCHKVLALDPKNAKAYNNICAANNKLRRFNEAIEACELSLKFDPSSRLAKGNLDWAKSRKAALKPQ
jgi:tetratricopeptide (TPR) repeat protein